MGKDNQMWLKRRREKLQVAGSSSSFVSEFPSVRVEGSFCSGHIVAVASVRIDHREKGKH